MAYVKDFDSNRKDTFSSQDSSCVSNAQSICGLVFINLVLQFTKHAITLNSHKCSDFLCMFIELRFFLVNVLSIETLYALVSMIE